MLNIEYRPLGMLKKLKNNPRTIKKADFERLKTSIKDNPDYFEARPLILSDRTGELVIIAGNQRYEASKALGLAEVPTVLLKGLTEEREKEIIIRDNVANGEWDMDILANEWDAAALENWGAPSLNFAYDVIEKASEETDDWNEDTDYDLSKLYREKINDLIVDDVEQGIASGEIRPEIAEILKARAMQCAVFNYDQIIKFYRSGDASETEKDLLRRLYLVFITPKEAFERGLLSMSDTANRITSGELMTRMNEDVNE